MKLFIFRAFMISGLRRLGYRYPPRTECLRRARVERGQYRCAKCQEIVGRKEIQVDHIEPVIDPKTGFPTLDGADDWNMFIKRMFPSLEGYQALCKPCHYEKSKVENSARRKKTVAKRKSAI